ncbi:MAG: matrixin family metalloprotease [Myxococcota bacterium]
MFQRFHSALSFLPLVSVLAWAEPVFAYCRTTTCFVEPGPATCGGPSSRRNAKTGCLASGKPLYWPTPCVSFAVQEGGSSALGLDYNEAEQLVTAAFARWVNAPCNNGTPSIALLSDGPLTCEMRSYSASAPANAILFRDYDWSYGPEAIALTTVTFDEDSGEIRSADTEINTQNFHMSPETLSYVLTHEAGHFLGLDHSAHRSAIMFGEYSVAGAADHPSPPMLNEDDVAGICAIYPPGRSTKGECSFASELRFDSQCNPLPEESCSYSGRPSDHGELGLWGLAGLVLFQGRRAAKRRSMSCASSSRPSS